LDKNNTTSSNILVRDDLYVDNNERGARKFDPNKYLKDAHKLKDQFFDTLYEDPHGLMYRSVFYTGQSYMDCNHYKEAIQWYTLYIHLIDAWAEERFEAYMRIAKCMMHLDFPTEKIKYHIEKAIELFPDRAEPNYILGKYYNSKSRCDLGYGYLRAAYEKNIDEVSKKYVLFVNKYMYGKHLCDELSVACFWTNRGQEGYDLLMKIIDDPDFEHTRERLLQNKQHFLNRYPDIVQ
jgi:tetratricopeptide (TPR) repeat protein